MRKDKVRRRLLLTLQGEEGNQNQAQDQIIYIDPYELNPLLFPINPNWKWTMIKLKDFTIPPKSKHIVWDMDGSGWVYTVVMRCNSPKTVMRIDVQADGLLEIETDVESLRDMGLVIPQNGQITVTNYDDTNNDYTVVFFPAGWGVPFRGMNRGTIYNPTESEIKIKLLDVWILELL